VYSVLLIFPGYFAISLYKVYKPKIGELIRKTLFVIVTYGIAVLIAVVFFVIFIAWLIGELEWDDIFS